MFAILRRRKKKAVEEAGDVVVAKGMDEEDQAYIDREKTENTHVMGEDGYFDEVDAANDGFDEGYEQDYGQAGYDYDTGEQQGLVNRR